MAEEPLNQVPASVKPQSGRWLLGFSGAVGAVVTSFLPWMVMPTHVAESVSFSGLVLSDDLLHVAGVHTNPGLLGLAAAIIAVLGWLLQRRIIALLGSLCSCVLGWWLYLVWMPSLGVQIAPDWGLLAFCCAGTVSLLWTPLAARQMGTVEGRRVTRDWIFRRLNPGDDDSKAVDTLIITLIAFNVLAVIAETEQEIAVEYATFFLVNETISTLIFSLEYVLRVWVSNALPTYAGERSLIARLKYSKTPMALIDFVAIAPFFLSFIQMDLRIARAIRLMRLVRILKIGRYAHAVKTLANVIARKKEELAIATFVTVMVLILSASFMYFAEHEAQPEAFRSIPASMWWAVVTITSVGYGDVSPITGMGKVLGAGICMIGVVIVALPTGILASGFLEEMREQRRGKDTDVFGFCPHCGEQLMPDEELD
ncbi:MAG: ion transporter [Myxococcota bacterium]